MAYCYREFIQECNQFCSKIGTLSYPITAKIVEIDDDTSYAPEEDSTENPQYLNITLVEESISDKHAFEYNIDILYSVILNMPELYFNITLIDKDTGNQIRILNTLDDIKETELSCIFEGMDETQQINFVTPKYHPITNLIALTLHQCNLSKLLECKVDAENRNSLNRWISFTFQSIGIVSIYTDIEFIKKIFK